ncbi:hypothetical protein [Aquimarina sp. BL5]|uniref:hypothetical protein n=1 Tax=Aquimarina sp. BL5 TaxID=1714860 RepID=UPI000EA9F547|nr:hypothetical protein [Aquimarina sp. BL5]
MNLHIESIIWVNNGQSSYSPHFLFFFILNFLSFFSSNVTIMTLVAVLLLAISTLGKYVISKYMLSEVVLDSKFEYKVLLIKVISFALIFCFAIPDVYNFFVLEKMYLGRIPSVVWHNSTVIAVFPLAILLFWKQLKIFDKNYNSLWSKDIWFITLLVVLNIFVKPSFIFVYAPVTALFLVKDFTLEKRISHSIKFFPLFIGLVVLFLQYISIYYYQTGTFVSGKSSLTIGAPFEFVRNFIPAWYIPIALFFSFAFPIAAIYYHRDILKNKAFLYALCLTIFGILISAFIVEDGPRRLHGNFTWQNIICAYILLLSTATFLLPKLLSKNEDVKIKIILWTVFMLHFLSGILYLFKLYFVDSKLVHAH